MKGIFLTLFLISNAVWGQKIIWKSDLKLTWANFKSKTNNMNGSNVVAYTHCGWEYSVLTSSDMKAPVKIEFETIFNEDKSWKDDKRINDYILLHEQKHFDIAELHARKLRKEVAEKVITNADYKKYFKDIYNKISEEYRNFQVSYDRETDHGMNKEKQNQYNILITEELEKLKNYQKS
ncbi:DUF922 domain-containing Zn-dependent protease [Chryseobacterium sp. GMJ5]|uniref:DUF922 domain-containing Zn-dependent protease n=1 Tax=Chryseobacterium gilvum TaxID=2976534 RepID=A0ABT2VUX8_9FLAO|nr:DUF922 domain-containing Zn-dependent protease [Chryseobacterium gilvum]MCU7613560.1 DUF922 domain-containing Zn-dependent protease [Chryseobacterium gilvum]